MDENRIIIAGYGGGCFPSFSEVLTPTGYIKISDLKTGDRVISFNDKGQLSESVISQTFVHSNYEVYEYTYWGGKIYATPNHWVLNQDNSFSEIGKLTNRDCLIDHKNHLRPFISGKKYSDENVYNLSVVPDHTYIVNGIRVHNDGGDKGGGASATEAPEGIITGDIRVLSKTQIETLDLLSEGEIQGLVTGEYTYTGVLGAIGWSGVIFTLNSEAIGAGIRWLQSIYWNDTPLVDKTGQYNFQQINVNISKGNPNGTNISDSILDELTVTRLISERLYGGGENFAKVYRILDKECIGANINVRVNQLAEQNTHGDVFETTINYTIYYKPLFNNHSFNSYLLGKAETIKGKVMAGYIRTTRINFDTNYSKDNNFLGWEIKIVRATEDSTTMRIRNQSFIDSLTEIYGSKFIYPNSAIISSLFDATYFSQIPARTYLCQGLKVKVPSNYDPIYKTYNESVPWSGTFKEYDSGPYVGKIKKEWTDNPAWCYYDLLTNKRYGLGNYIDEDFIDKFSLYEIGKYCDTLVADGYGGLEPRFTCNAYITSQEEAYKMVNSMASIFRGITYYSAGQIYTAQDAEKQPIYQFTNANIIEGDFTYSSSAKKARHTIAIVRYNDKKNFYKPTLEYVEDIDAIRKYGLRDVEVPAFGCTSKGQAVRLGRWALLTESLETESINFKAGLEVAGFLRPGDIFQIYDKNRKTQRLGGRLYDISVSPTGSNLFLDSEITGLDTNTLYKLSLLTPSYYYDPAQVTGMGIDDFSGFRRSQIQYLTGNYTNFYNISGRTKFSVSQNLDYTNYDVSGNYVWLIEATGNNVFGNIRSNEWETYRVINIKENDTHIYEIDGLQYDINKFLQIESGFSFTDSVFGQQLTFASPTNLQLSLANPPPSTHSKLINYVFTISNTNNIKNYRIFVKKDSDFTVNDINSSDYIIAELPVNTFNGSYLPTSNGRYYFRVYAIGNNDALSASFASNSIDIVGVNPLQDITINSLQLYTGTLINNMAGTRDAIIYSSSSPEFTWQVGLGNIGNLPNDLLYRISIRAPSNNNQPNSEIYFQQTGYKSNNLTYIFQFTGNYNSISTAQRRGPFREFDIVIEAHDVNGYSSAGGYFNGLGQDISNYTNSNGYDILYANNPRPNPICLYTGYTDTNFYQTGKATQEWITQDGEIKVFFTNSGNTTSLQEFFGDDIAGGNLYYSSSPFTRSDLLPPTPRSDIKIGKVTSNNNPIIFPANLTNVSQQYVAIAPFDDFDIAINNRITNYLSTGIDFCDPVIIEKRASFKVFISNEITLSPGTILYDQPHNLGYPASNIRWVLICKSAEHGWVPGDEINIHSVQNFTIVYQVPWDPTQGIKYKYYSQIFTPFNTDSRIGILMSSDSPYIMSKLPIGQIREIDINKWKAKCYVS